MVRAEHAAFSGGLAFIAQAARPDDSLCAVPEGSSLNFCWSPALPRLLSPAVCPPAALAAWIPSPPFDRRSSRFRRLTEPIGWNVDRLLQLVSSYSVVAFVATASTNLFV
jgi:hypothetical protein